MAGVKWIEEPVRERREGVLGAAAVVATSGVVPALLLLGVLGLAVYGLVKAAERFENEEDS